MRKEIDVTITAENRDRGKVFHIREMSAAQAERWAIRALQAASRGGVEISEEDQNAGWVKIAEIGLRALAKSNFADIEPLLAEVLSCVSYNYDPSKPGSTRKLNADDDIEEVDTLFRLRQEVFYLHMGFSTSAAPSTSSQTLKPPASLNTQTSQDQSAQSSHRVKQR